MLWRVNMSSLSSKCKGRVLLWAQTCQYLNKDGEFDPVAKSCSNSMKFFVMPRYVRNKIEIKLNIRLCSTYSFVVWKINLGLKVQADRIKGNQNSSRTKRTDITGTECEDRYNLSLEGITASMFTSLEELKFWPLTRPHRELDNSLDTFGRNNL